MGGAQHTLAEGWGECGEGNGATAHPTFPKAFGEWRRNEGSLAPAPPSILHQV